MNKRRKLLIIVSGVLLCTLIPQVQANPNHLEPIRPYYSIDIGSSIHGYGQAVFTSLIGTGWNPSPWMIERASFSREYAVIVWRSIEYDRNDPHPRKIKRTQWFVEYVAAKEKIWRFKHSDNDEEVLDIRPTKEVERHRVPITAEFAKVVQEAWWSTLQLTRYAEGSQQGLDGTTLEFCCGDLFGRAWSPRSGLPAMLADLGRKLRAVALSEEKNRDSLLEQADSLARKIAEDAEAEQIRLLGKKRRMNIRGATR